MGLRVNSVYQVSIVAVAGREEEEKERKKRRTFLKYDVTLGGFLSINCEGHGFVSRQDG